MIGKIIVILSLIEIALSLNIMCGFSTEKWIFKYKKLYSIIHTLFYVIY